MNCKLQTSKLLQMSSSYNQRRIKNKNLKKSRIFQWRPIPSRCFLWTQFAYDTRRNSIFGPSSLNPVYLVKAVYGTLLTPVRVTASLGIGFFRFRIGAKIRLGKSVLCFFFFLNLLYLPIVNGTTGIEPDKQTSPTCNQRTTETSAVWADVVVAAAG